MPVSSAQSLVVLTATYPAVAPYFGEFIRSLSGQTDPSFSLVVVDDGMQNLERCLSGSGLTTHLIRSAPGATPAAIRRLGLRSALKLGSGWVVFLDADDLAQADRIATLRRACAATPEDILFHDMVLFGSGISTERMFGSLFSSGQTIGLSEICEGNALGLSNTAIRADAVSPIIDLIPDQIIAFDWAFFSLAMLKMRTRAKYLGRAMSRYRQHENNLSMSVSMSDEFICRAVQVKAQHFRLMASHESGFEQCADEFERLYDLIGLRDDVRSAYCTAMRRRKPKPLWWAVAAAPGANLAHMA